MLNLVLFGPPGAGKGTQSEKLIEKYQLVHISTGDIFRAHIKDQTDLGKQVSQIIAEGNLVPDSVTIAMLEEEIKKNPEAKGFIFDGFPRTVAQAEALDQFLASIETSISGVIALDVTEQELTERIEEYFNKTIHVLPYYETQGKLTKVNGIGEIEAIFGELTSVIDAYRATA
jgi:adenylate kinase